MTGRNSIFPARWLARRLAALVALALVFSLTGCGGGGSGGGGPPGSGFTIGGSLSGLAGGRSVTLLNNAGDALTLSSNGAFTFASPVPAGGSYLVTVRSQPAGQVCTVGEGTGSGVNANVTNVSVICSSSTYTIGGSVSGLAAGQSLSLLNNGSDSLRVSGNGSFSFPTAVARGASYVVTVGTQPAAQVCSHSQGSAIWGIAIDPKAPFAYVSDQTSSLIFAYSIGSDGTLNAAGFSAASGSQPTNLLVDSGGHYLYVANQGANSISQYTLGSNGAPTPMSPASVPTGSSPLFLAIDSSGRYLYATNGSASPRRWRRGPLTQSRLAPNRQRNGVACPAARASDRRSRLESRPLSAHRAVTPSVAH